jgi:hypothetical protein
VSWAGKLAGPLAIVAAVLFALEDYAFGGMSSSSAPDVLPSWLPWHCYLGKSIASGSMPSWNPHVMGGVPFASNPQSGWMYLPAMLAYAAIPCHAALNSFVVSQPLIAGLGMYWFLRGEHLGRPAATTGGLVLALSIAGSSISLTLPFGATLAWTTITLGCASRYLDTRDSRRMTLWLIAGALSWGQVVGAHLSFGTLIASAALAFFLVFKVLAQQQRGAGSVARQSVLSLVLIVSLPALNLAALVPRIAFLPKTNLGLGYERMIDLGRQLQGFEVLPDVTRAGHTLAPTWPFALGLPGGVYLGGIALVLLFAGWWDTKHRYLMRAFTLMASVFYLLGLEPVANAALAVVRVEFVQGLFVHHVTRLGYGVLLAVAVLSAVGVEAYRRPVPVRVHAFMALPGLVVWIVPLLTSGVSEIVLRLVLASLLVTLTALVVSRRAPSRRLVIPTVLALDLTMNAVLGPALISDASPLAGLKPRPFSAWPPPDVPTALYTRPGRIARALHRAGGERFLSYVPTTGPLEDPGLPRSYLGYLPLRGPEYWGLLANQRALLLGLEDAQGQSPVQLLRYWKFMRAVSPKYIKYSTAVFLEPPVAALELLQVNYAVAPDGAEPMHGRWNPILRQERFTLLEKENKTPRVSLVSDWRVVRSSEESFGIVTAENFDPSRAVILESDPAIPRTGKPDRSATATFRWLGTSSARVKVATEKPALLLVRNVYDSNWRATIDGRQARVLPANYLIQAIPVPKGSHEVVLSYEDTAIGYGLIASGGVLLLLLLGGPPLLERIRPSA